MNHLPIFLDVRGQQTAVVGGGVAAARRAETLLKAGARVTVFAAAPSADFDALARHASLTLVGDEPSRPEDFAGLRVCVVASDDAAKDARMHALAKAAGVLTNVAAHPELCDFLLPAVIDRDPVTIAISTGGASPILARRLRVKLETTIPSGYGRLAEFVGAARSRVAELLPDRVARRRFWERLLDGPAAELALLGDAARAEATLAAELDRMATKEGPGVGEVYLVGAGPGDPDLLTFRALRLMQQADVVLYDRLVDPAILDLVRREAERVYVGKRPRDHVAPQGEISEMLVRFAKQGKRVLRLKGGDPFVFGRGGEEIETLAEQRVPFQVCPGITAAIGCSAYSGIPLTHRDHAQACIFVTAHGRDGPVGRDWNALVRPGQTVAIYMGLGHIEQTMSDFVAAGVDPQTPAAIVDNGARPTQRVVVATVATLAMAARDAGLRGPTIIIVGSVVTLREKLNWNAAGGGQRTGDPPRGSPSADNAL
jgi:uroporphyrin-III C-methyltransferase / precorrin-2 dehydrogenase / sirohydrochlorin ferrochelatase